MTGWPTSIRLARRDLNRSLRGLRLLFVCIFLGVATLATIGSLAAALTDEIANRGQTILGGDVQVSMNQRRASERELGAMRSAGTVSETIRMRSMARLPGTERAVLTELKGIDDAYPLYGAFRVDGNEARPLAPGDIYITRDLADQLGVRDGALRYGNADFRIAGIISEEPDRVGEGFTLGPVAIVSLAGMQRTGLLQPGSLFTTKYRIQLPLSANPEGVVEALRTRFPNSSWEIRDRDNAAAGLSRFFDRMGQFLTLTGLAALIIAGIGVSNGVSSYLRTKRESIATLKMMGARSQDIGRMYLVQIGGVALLAVIAGLAVGAALLPIALGLAGDLLPIRPEASLHPLPLATSAAYGVMMAVVFALPPLARARMLPVAALFRQDVAENRRLPRPALLTVGAAALLTIGLVLGMSDRPAFSAGVLGSALAVLLLLAAVGLAIRRLARAVPRPRRPLLRLALTGLHRPGAATVPLVVALGLALTLFVTLAAIQTSLTAEIERTVPDRAPDRFVLDIPVEEQERFEAIVRRAAPAAEVAVVPTLRGTITALHGRPATREQREQFPFLFGERGVTYASTLPAGSTITAGEWWPADYRGPPLVSLDADAAEPLGLRVGDTVTVSVLGREIEARIASLRAIEWETMGFNYILVFPPSTLRNAPHNVAATISSDPGGAAAAAREVVRQFPSASVIDVGDVIGRVSQILDQVAAAILIAASVAILAGIAVLIGALAASREARSYDSVIMKTLGATRRQILSVQVLEYGVLAFVVGSLALALGLAGAWYVVVQLFEFGWRPDWGVVLATLAGGTILTLGVAVLGSLPILSTRPASALRQL